MATLRGSWWNGVEDAIVKQAIAIEEVVVEALMEDGYPPGAEPLDARGQYERLVALRLINDPAYWENPAAQAALESLALRFGPPPAPAASPFAPPEVT